MKVKAKMVASYKGHQVKPTGVVEISFGLKYEEMINYVQTLQMLNENIDMHVKIDGKSSKVGSWMVRGLNIDHDGNAIIKFNSTIQSIDSSVLNDIADFDGKDMIPMMLSAEIEDVEDEDDDE